MQPGDEITLTATEAAMIDAIRLAFARDQLTTLPGALARLAGTEVGDDRLLLVKLAAWEEQASAALSDKVLTPAELDFLSQAALALEILGHLRGRPSYHQVMAAQRGEAKAWRKRAPRKVQAEIVTEVVVSMVPGRPNVSLVSSSAPDDDRYPVAAVGESHYQEALQRAKGDRESPAHVDATLVPEDDNVYDPRAVRVDVHGNCVGYLSRTHAVIYRRRYGPRSTSCKGQLHGGEGAKRSVGIWLDVLL